MSRFMRDMVEADGGLYLPRRYVNQIGQATGNPTTLSNGVAGFTAVSDSEGVMRWADKTPPAIQLGFEGNVNPGPITGTISSGGQFTFTNMPFGDAAWFQMLYQAGVSNTLPGALMRGYVPLFDPVTHQVSLSSAGYGYYALILVPQGTTTAADGAAGTIAAYVPTAQIFGSPYSTAALAGAAAIGAQTGITATSGGAANGILLWDCVVHFDGTNYTLVAGGSVPSTGRDRRQWSAGGYKRIEYGGGNYNLTTASIGVPLDSTNLSVRMECSGKPLRLSFAGLAWTGSASDSEWFNMCWLLDGTTVLQAGGVNQAPYGWVNANPFNTGFTYLYDYAPSAGSHLFQPCVWNPNAVSITINAATPTVWMSVEEIMKVNAGNGTA